MIQQLKSHIARIKYQLGRHLILGSRKYRLRGYLANRFASDFHHEPFMTQVLERALKKKAGAFIDIGANIGQTLIKVLAIDANRTYVGFEPQIGCCFFINQFLIDNALSRARIIPLALSNSNGILSLYSNNAYDEMASIVGKEQVDGKARRSVTSVASRIGDEVLEEIEIQDIAVIKIDVEGAELQVLSGIIKTLRTKRPIVIFEVLPNFYGHDRTLNDPVSRACNTTTADALFKLIVGAGYKISQIDEYGEEKAIERFDLNDREGFVGSNFIAHPIS